MESSDSSIQVGLDEVIHEVSDGNNSEFSGEEGEECEDEEDGIDLSDSPIDTTNVHLAIPGTSCLPANLTGPQEIVVIGPDGGIIKLSDSQKMLVLQSQDAEDPLSKRICVEQDGHTYIFTVRGNGAISSGLELNTAHAPQIIAASELLTVPNGDDIGGESDVNQAWFTSREDKSNLQSKGHLWKQGMWSKDEIDMLEENIQKYCEERSVGDPATVIFDMAKDERKDFYRTVAKGLHRPLFSVYRRVIRMYDNKNHVGKYTPEELDRLKKLRSVYGNDWQSIGAAMGRSASSIKDRCRLMKENCNQGKWLPAEERRLADAVYELANAVPGEMISSGLSWALVAERVGTRSEKQCRTKWLNYLNWKEAGGTEWTREDDMTLICRVYALGVTDENHIDWSEMAKNWPSVRSPQWLRGKWWTVKRHVPNETTAAFSEICEYLYQQYAQKIRVKEEAGMIAISSAAIPLHPRAHSRNTVRRQPTILRPGPLAATQALLPGGIATTTVVSATDIATLTAPAVTTMGMTPILQTLEVLPQGIHLTAASTPPTFLLTQQPTIPLATSIAPSQIIIRAISAHGLQVNENVAVQMSNPPIIVSAAAPTTAFAATQLSSHPVSPELGASGLEPHESLIDDEAYECQGDVEDSEVDNVDDGDNDQSQEVSLHLIMSDPMLAANNSPEIIMGSAGDIDKGHASDDALDVSGVR